MSNTGKDKCWGEKGIKSFKIPLVASSMTIKYGSACVHTPRSFNTCNEDIDQARTAKAA